MGCCWSSDSWYSYHVVLLKILKEIKKAFSSYKKSKLIQVSLLIGTTALLLYIVNRIYLKGVLNWVFVQHYFNDVLAGMVIVAFVNILAVLGNQRRLLLIRFFRILLFTSVCGLFWEYITPLYLSYSVADPLDVLAYMSGGVLYWGIIRITTKKNFKGKNLFSIVSTVK